MGKQLDTKALRKLFKGRLTPENRDKRLLALADHLDTCHVLSRNKNAADHRAYQSFYTDEFAVKEGAFTMEATNYKCGAPACLIGHGIALGGGFTVHGGTQIYNFAKIYGVTPKQAEKLYAPSTKKFVWSFVPGRPGYIGPQHAAAVLRYLVEIGIVDWDAVGKRLGCEPCVRGYPY